MKRKATLFVGIIFIVVMALSFVHADDATPEPGTPQENECNPGGVLYREANQDGCPTEWYWKAGWYLAAVNNGRISRDDVPDEFKSVLPPVLQPTPEETQTPTDPNDPQDLPELPIGSCWVSPSPNGLAIQYLGPPNTLKNVRTFGDNRCIPVQGSIIEHIALVYAHNLAEATVICSSLGEIDALATYQDQLIPTPSYVYYCAIKDGTAR
jgi:hypothetical protein